MEIFRLFGSIFVDNAEANKSIAKTGKEAEKSGDFLSKMGDVAKAAGKAVAVGTAAAGAAFVALTTKSVKAYADYEQLVGGVETLFGDSSGTILKYAENAYKTANLSANQYMETITGFSASLLQGLGGDTAKAAEIGNLAVTDMADNANKMGTAIESIQNAYQGFAKDNFTMLDNLKLGYGGTASEMARLVNDSGVLGDSFKVTAQNVKDIPFDQLVLAIHEVQTEMGITGTTAIEATETISGSWNTLKSAWTNVTTALASDNKDFLDNSIGALTSSTNDFANNLTTAVTNVINNTTESLPQIFTAFESMMPLLFDTIIPAMATGATKLITGLAKGIIDNLPLILGAAQKITTTILVGIGDAAPVIKPVTDALGLLITNFDKALAALTPLVAGFVTWKAAVSIAGIIQGFTTAMGGMKGAITVTEIAQKLLNTTMLANPFVLVATVVGTLTAAVITLWKTNENFRDGVIRAWDNIKTAITTAINAVITPINSLTSAMNNLLGTEIKPIELLVDTAKATEQIDEFAGGIITATDRSKVLGLELGEAIADGLENGTPAVGGAAKGVADKVDEELQKLKDKLTKTYDTILGITSDMFSALDTKIKITVNDMILNLAKNQLAVAEWSENIAILAARGIDDGLLTTLREAGPQAAGYVAELVKASDKELQTLSTLFANSGASATAAMAASFEQDISVVTASGKLADSAIAAIENKKDDFIAAGGNLGEYIGEGMVLKSEWLEGVVEEYLDKAAETADQWLTRMNLRVVDGKLVTGTGARTTYTNEGGGGGSDISGPTKTVLDETGREVQISVYEKTAWEKLNDELEAEWRENLETTRAGEEKAAAASTNVTVNVSSVAQTVSEIASAVKSAFDVARWQT